MRGWLMRRAIGVVCLACLAVPLAGATKRQIQSTSTEAQAALPARAILDRYCVSCHNDRLATGGLSLDVHVHDLHATMLHLLGIDHTKLTFPFQGRNFRLTDVHGEVVQGVLA